MKSAVRRVALGAALLCSFSVALAADALTEGTVKKIDKTTGRVTLAHGPLTNLNMPGMTMAFGVQDAAWLGKLKAGDKVRFRAEARDGDYVVVQIEPRK